MDATVVQGTPVGMALQLEFLQGGRIQRRFELQAAREELRQLR